MGGAIRSGFVVTADTTRGQLDAFLSASDKGANTRLLGKTDPKTGATILYTSEKRASLFDRLSGRAGHRRADARAAISSVLSRYGEQRIQARGLGAQGVKILFNKVRSRVSGSETSALRVGAAKSASDDMKAVSSLLPKAGSSALAPGATDPGGPCLVL